LFENNTIHLQLCLLFNKIRGKKIFVAKKFRGKKCLTQNFFLKTILVDKIPGQTFSWQKINRGKKNLWQFIFFKQYYSTKFVAKPFRGKKNFVANFFFKNNTIRQNSWQNNFVAKKIQNTFLSIKRYFKLASNLKQNIPRNYPKH
jgi:hypothetical protein